MHLPESGARTHAIPLMGRMTNGRHFVVIVNPTSGGGAGVRMSAEVGRELRARGASFDLHVTNAPGHAVELAENAALDGAPVVVAAGGDGTVHEVANGLLRARARSPQCDCVLGIVPVGTGNDFVKMVPGTAVRARAWQTLTHGRIRALDAGYACWSGGSEYFVNAAGVGIDVEVVRRLGRRGRGGALPYILALLHALRTYRPLRMKMTVDSGQLERRVMTVAIANGRSIGGSFRICPDALADDGRLDVCLIEDLTLLPSLRTAAAILRGTHMRQPAVHMFRTQRVELSTGDGPMVFQLDGELREPAGVQTLTLEIRPGALPVLASPPQEAHA